MQTIDSELVHHKMCEAFWDRQKLIGEKIVEREDEKRTEIFLTEVWATLTGTLMASLSNSLTSVGEHVQQFSPLLAVLFFCSTVCNGVNSWTPLLLTQPTHVLSVAVWFFFTLLFSSSFTHSSSDQLRQIAFASVYL